jgi:hypothetical protein
VNRLVGRTRVAGELLRALGPMAFIELGLRTSTLPVLCRRLGLVVDLGSGAPPARRPAALPDGHRRAIRAALILVSRWPVGDTCLRRSLLVGHRLRRHGAVLRIGVARGPDGAFVAHSWLELDGATLDSSPADFAALGRMGG